MTCPICRATSQLIAVFIATDNISNDVPAATTTATATAAATPITVPKSPTHTSPPPLATPVQLTNEEYTTTRKALISLFANKLTIFALKCDTNLSLALKRARDNHLIKATDKHHIQRWISANSSVSVVVYKWIGAPQLSRGLKINNFYETEGTVQLRNAMLTTVPFEMVFGPKLG
jgi:hypothetical protein